MKRCLIFTAVFASSVLFSAAGASAQAIPAGHSGGALEVGLEYSNAHSDYVTKRISGIGGYATFDFSPHFGVEADARFLTLGTSQDFGERTYMVGTRYVYRKRRYEPYVKALVGLGQAVAEEPDAQGPFIPSTNFAFSVGVGLDIRIPKNLTVRAIDFEYQDWPGFGSTYGNGLSPTVISFGIAYRIR